MVYSSVSSAFHPYTRPAAPNPPADSSLDESIRFLFTTEALLALSQMSNPAKQDAPKQTSPPSTAPILTPNPVTSPAAPLSDPLQSPTVSLPQEKSRRKRTTFSPEQATRLESEYLNDSYMAREKRLLLAQSLSLSENQVKTWFQNRRAKDKRDRKTDNSSHSASSRKCSPSRKSSSDSSPTPSAVSTSSFALPTSYTQIQTATSPTTVEALLLTSPPTPPARVIQKVEQSASQQQFANLLLPNLDSFNSYLQSLVSGGPLPPSVQSLLVSSPPPLFDPSILASFQTPLQSATI